MKEINIELIMNSVREDIQEKGYKLTDLNFEDIPIITIKEEYIDETYDFYILKTNLESARALSHLDYYYPIEEKNLKGLLKRCIRKFNKPILYRIIQQQEKYNIALLHTVNQLNNRVQELESKIESIDDRKVI